MDCICGFVGPNQSDAIQHWCGGMLVTIKYIGHRLPLDDLNIGTPSVDRMRPVCSGTERNSSSDINPLNALPSCKSLRCVSL